MNGQGILEEMKELGFTEYEVKAYLSLLGHYPVNGYTLSKESGVPRSRIYEVLKGLIQKQAVFEKHLEKATLYYPLEPALMMSRLRRHYHELFARVESHAQRVYSAPKEEHRLMILTGRENILEFLKLALKHAQYRIALSIWPEEYEQILPELTAAEKRGVAVKGIYFGTPAVMEGLLPHRRIERYLGEKKERTLIAVVDREQVLTGIISRGENSQATWTKDPGFVDMGEDYIAHDLIVNAYAFHLEPEQRVEYEAFTDQVREAYYGLTGEGLAVWRGPARE